MPPSQIWADQLNLYLTGGVDYGHHIPGFSDLPTALYVSYHRIRYTSGIKTNLLSQRSTENGLKVKIEKQSRSQKIRSVDEISREKVATFKDPATFRYKLRHRITPLCRVKLRKT